MKNNYFHMSQNNPILEILQIDDEINFDANHVAMNYLKMNLFSPNCFANTNIKANPSIYNKNYPLEEMQKLQEFSLKYFNSIAKFEDAIDVLVPMIINYAKSDFGLFLSTVLNQHILENAEILRDRKENFEKYKKILLNLFHSMPNESFKLIDQICASITAIIILGLNGNWAVGFEQLINSSTENKNMNCENALLATLIISNVGDIIAKLKLNLSLDNIESITYYLQENSKIIKEFAELLANKAFIGSNEKYVNKPIFKAFIRMLQSFKLFNINVSKLNGIIELLLKSILLADISQELIIQICDVFANIFSAENNYNIIFDSKNAYNFNYFTEFLNNIMEIADFDNIKKCIEFINDAIDNFAKKDINKIKENKKDIQILFALCNIFSIICKNFTYIFFLPEFDNIIEKIFSYFINLPIYPVNQLLFNTLNNLSSYFYYGYCFNNYSQKENLLNNKMQTFKNFLYDIHNSVFENMRLSSINEYHNINLHAFAFNNNIKLEKNIIEYLKKSYYDDNKANYIIEANEFYENLYQIIFSLYGIKDFINSLCEFLKNCINKKDFIEIDVFFIVFNKIAKNLQIDYPQILLNLFDYILIENNYLFSDIRFVFHFILLVKESRLDFSNNTKYFGLIIKNLLIQNYENEKMDLIIITFIFQLIKIAYEIRKNNNHAIENSEEDKKSLMAVFNELSQYLLANIEKRQNNTFLIKLIDSVFISAYFNIYSNYLQFNVVYNIADKLFDEANQILNIAYKSNNKNELIMKYIYILFAIVKNLANENYLLLAEFYNKVYANESNANISHFESISNNIIIIVNNFSETAANYDINILNSILSLCNIMICPLKEQTLSFYNLFSEIIDHIQKINPINNKDISLRIALFKNILCYCKSSSLFNDINSKCFDIINFLNSKLEKEKNADQQVLISKNICQFILLFEPYKSQNFELICLQNSKNNSIFSDSFNALLKTYENNNDEDYNYIFANMIKSLCENFYIFNGFINAYISRITKAIFNNLNYFKSSSNKCMSLYFMIFQIFNLKSNEKFQYALEDIFNSDYLIIYSICNYLESENYTAHNNLAIKIENEEFLQELGELLFANNAKKRDFVDKYCKIVINMNMKK